MRSNSTRAVFVSIKFLGLLIAVALTGDLTRQGRNQIGTTRDLAPLPSVARQTRAHMPQRKTRNRVNREPVATMTESDQVTPVGFRNRASQRNVRRRLNRRGGIASTTNCPTGDIAAPPIDPPPQSGIVYLKQGWNDEQREDFYFLTQGSQLIPYQWFLALEQAGSDELFRANGHLQSLGFLPRPPSRRNPDGLPIGFALDDAPETVQWTFNMKQSFLGPDYKFENYPNTNKWLGLTCAACHTGELRHNGTTVRIDGGPALIDAGTLQVRLITALSETAKDDDKFERFAGRVLGELYNAGEAAALWQRLAAYTQTLHQRAEHNKPATPYGAARLDAFGAILNQICETALEIPENHGPSDAPVSYPFLWDTPRLDWVQWNGSVSSVIERNVGEVLGVFAHLQLTGTPETGQFTSTANIQNLDRLEQMLADLSAPPWPADILGPIDQTKAARGKELYAANCAMCHHERIDGQFPLTDPNEFGRRFIRTKMITAFPPDKDKIGTDPTMVANFAHRLVDPGPLRPHLPEEMREQPKVHAAIVLRVAVMAVVTRKLHEAGVPEDEIEEQIVALSGGRDPHALPPNIAGYKARPLNGIWATAPYLHNGSVPSLYQLLLPEDQRVKSFHVGDGQFDPVHVGYRTEKSPGSFEFRAVTADGQPIRGNSNLGHSGKYYTQAKQPDDTFRNFTDEERWALVEYMKKLQ